MSFLRTSALCALWVIAFTTDHSFASIIFDRSFFNTTFILFSIIVLTQTNQSIVQWSVFMGFMEGLYSPYIFIVPYGGFILTAIVLIILKRLLADHTSVLPLLGLIAVTPLIMFIFVGMLHFISLWLTVDTVAFPWSLRMIQQLGVVMLGNTLLAIVIMTIFRYIQKVLEHRFVWKTTL